MTTKLLVCGALILVLATGATAVPTDEQIISMVSKLMPDERDALLKINDATSRKDWKEALELIRASGREITTPQGIYFLGQRKGEVGAAASDYLLLIEGIDQMQSSGLLSPEDAKENQALRDKAVALAKPKEKEAE